MEILDLLDVDEVKEQIAERIYKEVIEEFYTWKQESCQQLLDELRIKEYLPPVIPDFPIHGYYNVTNFNIEDDDEDDTNAYIVEEFGDNITNPPDENGVRKPIAMQYIKGVDGGEVDHFEPYPSYTICTPASRSVHRTRVDEYNSMIKFIPFADDPDFDISIIDNYKKLAWQEDMSDPDLELICLETTRRLHFREHMSFNEIDATKVLPHVIRRNKNSGMLWDATQRDIPAWPGSELSGLQKLPKSAAPTNKTLFDKVNDGLEIFCPNLNCLHSECDIHHGIKYPRLNPAQALLTNEEMRNDPEEPCGMQCFKLFDIDDATMNSVLWDNEKDVSDFESILKIVPDTTPCVMAGIMRKSCHEVFVYRTRILPDADIKENIPSDEHTQLPFAPRRFRDGPGEDGDREEPLVPCNHSGECNRLSGCECFAQEHHCGRNCRCSSKCPLRWKGCSCGKRSSKKSGGKQVCGINSNCLCVRMGKECDPELCKHCDARGAKKTRRCQNNIIQQEIYPQVVIKTAKWGLGAFSDSYIPEGHPIGEYVGELLWQDFEQDNIHFVDDLSAYTGLNYVFAFQKGVVVDAYRVGNETRYLNHSSKNANVVSEVIHVNGVNKNMLKTLRPIRKGEELLLNYGATYWVHGEPEEGESE